ncbi:hypothetical protein EFP18_21775 [Burkholderia glumae]|uniref:hypothetical protein n=1 Tax=Burkholderia glumae TaxID=337 RepID=UPI000F6013A6|nr:hypothetical protein [Burkholderia glumae]MCM2492756.1 hypothetical protein [Burkholderia glumae]MCM2544555.1 hypothetical protein [Burkholderia glumae]MCQ0030227.1 hypothetical protein [Burkholderia glumae]MCQ0037163.1 hypothetical protein [Burkholderia glumae]QJW78006.1 hypothetical protein GAS18_04100 [Burkholderia glumae]
MVNDDAGHSTESAARAGGGNNAMHRRARATGRCAAAIAAPAHRSATPPAFTIATCKTKPPAAGRYFERA